MPLRAPFRVQAQRRPAIDLQTVRDTLLYIESDVANAPELSALAIHIRAALAEVETLTESSGKLETETTVSAPIFLPMS